MNTKKMRFNSKFFIFREVNKMEEEFEFKAYGDDDDDYDDDDYDQD